MILLFLTNIVIFFIQYSIIGGVDISYFVQVNWIAVVLCAIFSLLFGALWYGPLFGKFWLKVIGKKQDEIQRSASMYILPFLAGLISAYILAVLIEGLAITLWWQGMLMGVIVWIGIGATATFTTGTFEDSPRGAWMLFLLYQFIVYAVEGIVFVVWKL